MNHQIDHSNNDHRLTAAGQSFIVFRQSAVLAQPGKRALDDPSFGQHDESTRQRTFDDLDEAPVPAARPIDEPAGVTAICKDQLQAAETGSQLSNQQLTAVAVLNIGRMNNQGDDQTDRVDDQMTLATQDFLARVVPTIPPFSAVFTDWLSMMPTLGVGLRPSFRRTRARSRS